MKNIKKFGLILLASTAVLLLTAGISFAQNASEQLFEKALYAEEMKGDLGEAVKIYQQVLKENPGNRQVSARALLHIGMCYEKLGSELAHQAYQDVINKYSEQAKEVSMARERITRLETFTAELSREAEKHMKNGNELFKRWEYESAVKEYENAIKLRPNTSLALNAQYCVGQSWFRAGKYDAALVTFTKLIEENPESNIAPVTELMVAQVKNAMRNDISQEKKSNSPDENIIIDQETGITYRKIKSFTGESDIITYTTDLNLSPNGKYLLCGNMVVPMDGTAPFELIEFSSTGIQATRGTWSPDGTKAAFFSGDAICVVPVSPETGHTTGPLKKINNEELRYQINPSWSPDGKKLAYQGKGDLWIIGVDASNLRNITATSDIKEIGPAWGGAWSPDGKTIAYGKRNSSFGLYDVEKDKFNDFAEVGFRCFPVWAPDGKWILLNWQKLHFYNLNNKSKFEFKPIEKAGSFFSWSPGGEKMLFYRTSYQYANGLKIASSSGGPSFEPVPRLINWGTPAWSDNSKVMAVQGEDEKGDIVYRIVPISGGESYIINLDNLIDGKSFPFNISSDLKELLFSDKDEGKAEADFYIVPVSASDARITGPAVKIFDKFKAEGPSAISTDGAKVALIQEGAIWVALTDGTDPVQVSDTAEKVEYIRWTPDGKAILFSTPSGWRLLKNPGPQGSVTKLLENGQEIKCRFWSIDICPDNSRFAVISDKQIKIIPLDGSKSGQTLDISKLDLTQDGYWLKWSPDGKNLAFIGAKKTDDPVLFPDGRWQIYSIPVNGGQPIRVAPDDDDSKDFLSWSPDGKWIAFSPMKPVKVRPESTLWEADFEEIKEKLAK
jgi:Tol biopolymer transport system component/outer membrane protein assembly factor BamD (BamD/ComL family)